MLCAALRYRTPTRQDIATNAMGPADVCAHAGVHVVACVCDGGAGSRVRVTHPGGSTLRCATMMKVHWVNIFFKAGPKLLRVVDGCDWDVGGASFE